MGPCYTEVSVADSHLRTQMHTLSPCTQSRVPYCQKKIIETMKNPRKDVEIAPVIFTCAAVHQLQVSVAYNYWVSPVH